MNFTELEAMEFRRREAGYLVTWECRENGLLRSDHCPDPHRGDSALGVHAAWELAERVARAIPNAVNIYVVHAEDFRPVSNYRERMLRPWGWCRTNRPVQGLT